MEVKVTQKHKPSRITMKHRLQAENNTSDHIINIPSEILSTGVIAVDLIEKLDGLSYVSDLYMGTTQ
jgi:hypothetical protein